MRMQCMTFQQEATTTKITEYYKFICLYNPWIIIIFYVCFKETKILPIDMKNLHLNSFFMIEMSMWMTFLHRNPSFFSTFRIFEREKCVSGMYLLELGVDNWIAAHTHKKPTSKKWMTFSWFRNQFQFALLRVIFFSGFWFIILSWNSYPVIKSSSANTFLITSLKLRLHSSFVRSFSSHLIAKTKFDFQSTSSSFMFSFYMYFFAALNRHLLCAQLKMNSSKMK